MIVDKNQFNDLKPKGDGNVIFGNNSRGQTKIIGSIDNNSFTNIENILFVRGLKLNLLSISQLSDKDLRVIFESMGCQVIDVKINKFVFIGYRQWNIYAVCLDNLSSKNVCFMVEKEDECWIWHRRLGHVSVHIISKLSQNDLVVG